MKPISPLGLPVGLSMSFWLIIGIGRLIWEEWILRGKNFHRPNKLLKSSDIAVLLPAHNEELVIKSSIHALKGVVRVKQIYVVSDGSTDDTYKLAKRQGCHLSRLNPGRGKARALVYLLNKFKLFDRYKLIFIVDADTRIDKDFIKNALPLFNDPQTSVVFGSARIIWPKHIIPRLKIYYIAYRERLNRILQYFMIYGQTWKYTNVNYVIPGFATIYRSKILRQLQIDKPGILIEDFNLAFQLHKKKLGKIGYLPTMIGWDQHPDNLIDYWKQVRRWNIGFFQTVRSNGVWFSFFWVSLALFSFEVLLNSISLILLVPLFVVFLLTFVFPQLTILPINWHSLFINVLISLFVIDYGTTVIIGLTNKKPQFLIYGLFFFIMHFITSLILIDSIIPGFFKSSDGKWISPTRRAE